MRYVLRRDSVGGELVWVVMDTATKTYLATMWATSFHTSRSREPNMSVNSGPKALSAGSTVLRDLRLTLTELRVTDWDVWLQAVQGAVDKLNKESG